ncbi:MAG: alpha/beta hydrolase [Chloroflexi bacterium OHK40]
MPHVTTNDGYRLHYEERGQGEPLVLVHGWSQSAAMFMHQLNGLSDRYHVIALDLRGHGESDKPAHGYRISRLAKDLYDALDELQLSDVNLLGWSMGCSVAWCYLDLFGPARLARLILVDEPAWVMHTPDQSADEIANTGAILDAAGLVGLYNALRSDTVATVSGFVGGMVTPDMPADLREWVIAENLKLPAEYAARLLLNHGSLDWRDVIPRISLPTLVIGGKHSHVNPQSQIWIHEQIPDSRLEIFEEGGSHFMFLEAPDRFNAVVDAFLQGR